MAKSLMSVLSEQLNDENKTHFKTLPKAQQEAVKQLMLLKFSQNMIDTLEELLDDNNKAHFQSLSKLEQETIKQAMMIDMLKDRYE
jgi:hypothetical protein